MCPVFPLRIAVKDSLVLILLVIFNTIHVTDLGKSYIKIIQLLYNLSFAL